MKVGTFTKVPIFSPAAAARAAALRPCMCTLWPSKTISETSNRAYLAESKHEILKSGKSTQPREIEGTGFWVMTNSPTPQKQQMVREVLELLGYSQAAVMAAVAVIQ